MADQTTPQSSPTPPSTPPIRPGITNPAPLLPPEPPKPTAPPQGLVFKDANLSNVTPSPAPQQTSPAPSFRANVRTMDGDVNSAARPKPPVPLTPPAPTMPPRPLTPSISIPPRPGTPLSPASSAVNIPETAPGSSRKWLIIGVLCVIVVIILIIILASGGSSEPAPTETPTSTSTPISTPTPPPAGFNELFTPTKSISYTSGNPTQARVDLNTAISQALTAPGELQMLMTGPAFVQDLGIQIPPAVLNTLDRNENFFVSIFGKVNGSKSRGFAVKIMDPATAQTALTAWEATMPKDLKTFLSINISRSSSPTFSSSTYQNTLVHYRNFPDSATTVDYAIVTLPNGSSYLVVTSTKDHMFAIIDRVQQRQP